MAQLIANEFASFALTPEEEESGSILNDYQSMVLQNYMSVIALEKLHLVLKPEELDDYKMQTAYKQGQLDTLKYLFEISENAKAALAQRQRPQQPDSSAQE